MSNPKTGAIAIFVKTPGLSPIKTRLAASIGRLAAERFHELSAKAIESVVRHASSAKALTAYWAVAEQGALNSPLWKSFPTTWQGDGKLGERLSRVYSELIERHPFVIFIGADSPLLTSRLLEESATVLAPGEEPTFVLGRAEDGGFYLFGGSAPVSRDLWLAVPYSTSNTALELAKRVESIGRIKELLPLLDVDTAEDLEKCFRAGTGRTDLTLEQWTLLKWVKEVIEEKK